MEKKINLTAMLLLWLFCNWYNYAGAQTFMSTVNELSDPFVTYYNGYYYYTGTSGGSVELKQATTLEGLRTAEGHVVFSPSMGGPASSYWAPEIYRINGKWYIYYSAKETPTSENRTFVIESSSTSPLTDTWVNKGRIYEPTTDAWAIDGTVFELNGSYYFAWSGRNTDTDIYQNIYVAKMSNPWTLDSARILISEPTLSWEENRINEGPEVIKRNGKVFLVYSACGCWNPNYELGMLYMNDTDDPLEASSWTKNPNPVFRKNTAVNVYGTGHHCFFKSPDGTQDWFMYHATPDSTGSCGSSRTVRAQRLYWNADGSPNFGQPIRQGDIQQAPSGEPLLPKSSVLENGIYKIINKGSNINLNLEGCNLNKGTNVIQSTDIDNNCQKWQVQAIDNGTFSISSFQSGNMIDVSGGSHDDDANILVWVPNGQANQQWQIVKTESEYYKIMSQESKKTLHAVSTADGANVVQRTFDNTDNQKWRFEKLDTGILTDGVYKIISKRSGKVLELSSCTTDNGGTIQQSDWNNTDCQKWKVTRTNDGFYKIVSVLSNNAITVPDSSQIPAEGLVQMADENTDYQQWLIKPIGTGLYQVFSKATGMSVDVSGCSTSPAAKILQYSYWGGDCQLWEFERITPFGIQALHKNETSLIRVFPIPSDNIVYLTGPKEGRSHVRLYNMLGTQITCPIIKNAERTVLDISGLQSGLYIIKTNTTINKFLKK